MSTDETLDVIGHALPIAAIPATGEGLARALGLDELGLTIWSITYDALREVYVISVCGPGLRRKPPFETVETMRLILEQPAKTRLSR